MARGSFCKGFIFLVPLFLFLFGCKNKFGQLPNIDDITDHPTLSAVDIDLYQSQNGKTNLRIIAHIVNVYSFQEEPTTDFPEGINVEFFDEDGVVTSYFRANSAIYYDKQNRWEAFGDIQAQNIEGAVFNTEYIEWDEISGEIKSDRAVKITDKEGTFYGRGFRSKQDFTDWTILNPTGEFLIDQNEFKGE